jgi:hypothetical protein
MIKLTAGSRDGIDKLIGIRAALPLHRGMGNRDEFLTSNTIRLFFTCTDCQMAKVSRQIAGDRILLLIIKVYFN